MTLRLIASISLFAALYAAGLSAQTYLIDENFNAGSTGWTVTQGGITNVWTLSTVGPSTNPGTLNGSQHMLVDADAGASAPGSLCSSTLTSPTFNGSTAPGALYLTFQQYFRLFQAGETGVVQVYNGSTWTSVLTVSATIGALSAPDVPVIDITAYKNAANQVRFVYQDNSNWGYYWLLDNIQVYYSAGAEIDVQRPAGASNSIASGGRSDVGQAAVGTPTNFSWTIANQGSASLTHTAVIAGSPAAVNCTFGTITLPASTASSATSTLTIPVTPTAAGFFTFRISITNNDSNENPYLIDVSGIALAGSVLFYGGDADLVDGTVNGRGYAVPNDVFIYEDFTVPAGQTWTVTQLFSNNYMSVAVATQADWEIRTGVATGTGGTLVGSGTGLNVSVYATGRSAFGYNEYTVITHLTTAQVLTAGTYFVGVRPVRTGLIGNVYCSTTSGTNGVGTPLGNDLAFGNQTGTQFTGLAWEQLNDGGTPPIFFDYSIGVRGTSSTGTGPTVTIDQAGGQADPTGTSPILFTAVFSAPVTGFATGDVSFTGSTAGGTLVGTVSGGPSTYTVTVTGMTTSGTVVATIAAAVCTATTGGQPNQGSTSTDNSVQWNAPAGPTVTINQGATQADPTSTSPIVFDVVFSAAVTGFATGDVTLGGTAGGTLVGTVSGSGTTYTVSVTGMTTSGTVVATIGAGVCTAVTGGLGNQASTSTDNSVQWNAPAGPTVTINQGASQADPTSTSPIVFDVVFSAAVTGFATGDVTLGGTAGGTLVGTVSGSGTTYTVSVTGMTTSGTVVATIGGGVCTAVTGGLGNQASTSTDNSVQWTVSVPVLTIVTTTLPNGVIGTAYNGTITAQNGTGPYTWSLASGTLPTGLTLNTAATGLTTSITGTPTAAGVFTFTVQVADSAAGTDTQLYNVTVTSSSGGGTIGGGGGGGGGCSADANNAPWFALAAVAGILLVAVRRRRIA